MKSIKRLFAVVMAIALIATYFVFPASAASLTLIDISYDGTIHVTGVQDGHDAYAKDHYGISWDATQKAWIFDNTVITSQDLTDVNKTIAVRFIGECTAIVKGTCNINGIDSAITSEPDYNYDTGDTISKAVLTIKGDGTLNLTAKDSCIWSQDTVNFEGTVNVNALSDEAWVCVHANKDIFFKLDKGGKVTAETKFLDEEQACAFNVASAKTIKLNREDGTDVTYPVGGKETMIGSDWTITEADGTTFAKKATVENKFVEYAIKETADEATWTKGGTEGQKITSTADFSKFQSVSVDGNVVDAANYDKSEGSTIITFKPAFLETLSVGKHPVVITSTDGSATGTLVIKEAPTPTPEEKPAEVEAVADTADTNAIAVFAALTALSAAGFVTVKKKEN